jgi:hypothetical protein
VCVASIVCLSIHPPPYPTIHPPNPNRPNQPTQAFVRDCSEVSPYALLLAARSLKQAHHTLQHQHYHGGGAGADNDDDHAGTLLLDEDGWVRLAAVGRIGALVAALKRRVDALLGAFVFVVIGWGGIAPHTRGCMHHIMAKMSCNTT